MLDLSGKVALVTGASRGVAAVAQLLAERGADIVINYRSKASRAEEIATSIRVIGRKAVLVQADITNENEVGEMMQRIATHFAQLDLLVLNASGGLEKDKSADYAMDLNLTAQERSKHVNRRLKIFLILAERYRNHRKPKRLRFNLIAALLKFELTLTS